MRNGAPRFARGVSRKKRFFCSQRGPLHDQDAVERGLQLHVPRVFKETRIENVPVSIREERQQVKEVIDPRPQVSREETHANYANACETLRRGSDCDESKE